ncbi:hypothetical protein BDZ94DRAFT_1266387, partial [Collybia nuda]
MREREVSRSQTTHTIQLVLVSALTLRGHRQFTTHQPSLTSALHRIGIPILANTVMEYGMLRYRGLQLIFKRIGISIIQLKDVIYLYIGLYP